MSYQGNGDIWNLT